jgi:hypothetical protein
MSCGSYRSLAVFRYRQPVRLFSASTFTGAPSRMTKNCHLPLSMSLIASLIVSFQGLSAAADVGDPLVGAMAPVPGDAGDFRALGHGVFVVRIRYATATISFGLQGRSAWGGRASTRPSRGGAL